MNILGWKHKDVWDKKGKHFIVEVKRHEVTPFESGGCFDSDGPHRWCVYAYIYPQHPHFSKFEGPNMWQDAACAMPLHGGPSFLQYPTYEGKVTSVKVGCDYNHLHDTRFTRYAEPKAAHEVFRDAETLYEWLTKRETHSEAA